VRGRRARTLVGLWVLAELVVYVLVAGWIGVGWTILATVVTSALGFALLGRQGTRALSELRERSRARQDPGRALGDAGLVAVGGLLMVLPGFLGDLVGLLCLLPGTRVLPRLLIARVVLNRLPDRMRGPVRVRSTRPEEVGAHGPGASAYGAAASDYGAGASAAGRPLVIEGEIVRAPGEQGSSA
jgi:UPF0716 protein FxsA